MTLAEFLLARYAEDEQRAYDEYVGGAETTRRTDAAQDRALADVRAKRRIVEMYKGTVNEEEWTLSNVMSFLAVPYRDHPDYSLEWKPVH